MADTPIPSPSGGGQGGGLDAFVVGAGPNGLAAAIVLVGAGKSVRVLEAESTIGGGTRSEALTLPGFIHDICSSVLPLALASPFFRTLPLSDHGLTYDHPPIPLAHPLDDGSAAVLDRSVDVTASGLGGDGAAYRRLMGPTVRHADLLTGQFLGPPRPSAHLVTIARFGIPALRSAAVLAASRFRTAQARALFVGLGAHSMLSLRRPATASFGLVLAAAGHAYGWPFARGGSQRVADALAAVLRARGGTIATDSRVGRMAQVSDGRVVLFDLTPRQILPIASDQWREGFSRQLQRFRYGPGVFKVDWALDGPIPWRAQACRQAGTVHVGGDFDEVVAAEDTVAEGQVAERPFVILAQPTVADPTRAPAGKHVGWAYCHVPNGSTIDMHERIEAQVERFAPGFTSRILARHVMSPADIERHNANNVGGDINGGISDLRQLFIRPTARLYRTPNPQLYLCSSSTPPGGGVHGMCGYFAARTALRRARW
ncbi:MAG TPA: NAD(P)/FAD-dependent oxidoreductase [Gemmatimonadales bacterium]|nr:NAD(P)/FAD-dependent oxidoreductase [Gemmatimonadales bacterium]